LAIGTFYARHLLALCVVVAAPCVLFTILYFVLLIWAIVFGGGIGSPIAYPIGLMVIFIAALGVGSMLFFPSTVFAEWIVKKRNLPVLAQIPITVGSLGTLCLLVSSIATANSAAPSLRGAFVGFATLFGILLLPLGLYWWTAQSGPLALAIIRRIFSAFQRS
jgi:hypothetical protein